MNYKLTLGFAVLLLVAGIAAVQQPSTQEKQQKPVKMDFEQSVQGWTVFPGADGKVERTQNPKDVHSGSYALVYSYTAAPGKMNILVHPEPEYFAQGFRFWVKTDRPTALLFVVSEEGDERWQTVVWTKHNQWQQVTIALSDLTAAEDSKTVNGKMDMDKAEGIGFMDVLALLGASDEAALLLGPQAGTHLIWLDDFEFLEQAPKRVSKPEILDDFKRDYLSWIGLRGVNLSLTSEGMEVRYQEEAPGFFGTLCGVPLKFFANTQGVRMRLKVKNPTTLAVAVEETEGERWMVQQEMGGEKEFKTFEWKWSQFSITDDTKGKGNGKLEPASIKMLSVLDLGVLLQMADPANTWVIAEVARVR